MSEAHDPAICDELVARLGELRASWAQIADAGGAQGSAGPASGAGRSASAEAGTMVTI